MMFVPYQCMDMITSLKILNIVEIMTIDFVKITISQSMIETKSLPSKLTNSPVVQFWGVLYKRAGEEPRRH